MAEHTFTPDQFVAGFSLLKLKNALTLVGVMDDRDDIDTVATRLKCGRRQARAVLEELERQGFVEKTKKRNQWDTTEKGRDLAYRWHPPRKYRPVIDYEGSDGVVGELFESVDCSIFRASNEQGDRFEEAQIQVGLCVDYDTDRLLEIGIWQPDDYEEPDSGALEALAVHVSADEAKRLVEILNEAIPKAEAELKRREAEGRRRAKRGRRKLAHEAKSEPPTTQEDEADSGAATSSAPVKPAKKEQVSAKTSVAEQTKGKEQTGTTSSNQQKRTALREAVESLRAANRANARRRPQPKKRK